VAEDLLSLADHGSNRLAILAEEIRAAHTAAVGAQKIAVERGRDAGIRLIEAKKLAGRGRWLPWLKENGVPTNTAAVYMRLARLPEDKFTEAVNLGLRPTIEAVLGGEDVKEESEEQTTAEWTEDELNRKAAAEAGEAVVANLHEDDALLAWAESEDRLQRIDRTSDFGNPFIIPDDGDRAEVVAKFQKFYWPHKAGLLTQVPNLGGKVLACWCHPQECHGHIIAETVNRALAGEGTAEEIADQIADHDG